MGTIVLVCNRSIGQIVDRLQGVSRSGCSESEMVTVSVAGLEEQTQKIVNLSLDNTADKNIYIGNSWFIFLD